MACWFRLDVNRVVENIKSQNLFDYDMLSTKLSANQREIGERSEVFPGLAKWLEDAGMAAATKEGLDNEPLMAPADHNTLGYRRAIEYLTALCKDCEENKERAVSAGIIQIVVRILLAMEKSTRAHNDTDQTGLNQLDFRSGVILLGIICVGSAAYTDVLCEALDGDVNVARMLLERHVGTAVTLAGHDEIASLLDTVCAPMVKASGRR